MPLLLCNYMLKRFCESFFFLFLARASLLTGRLPIRNGFYTTNAHARNGRRALVLHTLLEICKFEMLDLMFRINHFGICARDLGIAKLTMHSGTIFRDGFFVHVLQNRPMMQLQLCHNNIGSTNLFIFRFVCIFLDRYISPLLETFV